MFSSNYTLYGDIQRRIIAALEPFASDIEIYSIDENFLDLRGFEDRDLVAHVRAARARVLEWTTIATCAGLAPTKTLAKLGNAAAKKNPLFDGVADLRDPEIRNWVLDRFQVGDVWGVGSATARKLLGLDIATAGQLRDMPLKHARSVGGVVLERLILELQGTPTSVVEMIAPPRKGMAVTRSFGKPVEELEQLIGALAQYAMRASEKLRQHDLVAGRITIFFHTNRFKPERPQHSGSRAMTLTPMTADGFVLIEAARRGATAAYRSGFGYTKAGVILENLVAANAAPATLFDALDPKRDRLMTAVDAINTKFGKSTVIPAIQGFKEPWKTRADMKSPAWTTNIAEVPVAFAC